MNSLIKNIVELKEVQKYIEKINQNESPIVISGLNDVVKAMLANTTKKYTEKPICIITYNELQARKIIKDIQNFEEIAYFFPKKEITTYDYEAQSQEIAYERINILNKLYENKAKIIVTTIDAIIQTMIPKKSLYQNVITLKNSDIYDLDNIKKKLIALGYKRTDLVESKGEFSIRGGIVDIAINEKTGIRIEFWGDEVDSIREFSLSSQRTTEIQKSVTIYPSHEYLLENNIEEVYNNIRNRVYSQEVQDIVEQDLENIKANGHLNKLEKYFNCFYNKPETILDYLSDETVIILDEVTKIKQREEAISENNELVIKELIEKARVVPDGIRISKKFEDLISKTNNPLVYLESQDINTGLSKDKFKYIFSLNTREVNYHKATIPMMLEEIKRAIFMKKKICLLASNEKNAEDTASMLLAEEIAYKFISNLNTDLKNSEVVIGIGTISSGYEINNSNILVISTEEIFGGEVKKKKKVPTAFKEGEKVVFADLRIGDYIVHEKNGIGQFIGVNTITSDGKTKDYIKLRYKDDGILYIPTNQLDSIRKYIGGGEAAPKLNQLGSKEWAKAKEKVKSNLREIARNLIELYAKRSKAKGFAFSKDSEWQKQFEDNFPYQETDDQLRCIEEMKKDMELEKPMDRLLCGDVGYGKTEVAIRGAFKAVQDGKQVAYLVPTTVLANQQYESFKSRMEQYSVNVELLNRFRSAKQQTEIKKGLKLGTVDVVVGTHRILGKDIEFKDLGLLIIDEEHRFGVKAKEKLKEMKNTIDVLTMTATPIPRTMHMSVVGVRDMSVIYEPPQNRRPVQTYVLEYDKEIVREAIIKELSRDGQIFYLFNNVEGIELKANEIQNLVPEAKISFAHGRMTGTEIEEIMEEFIEHKTDVLVCTTILESGIDIPNANTIIVENADRLGLAQLYQIRGRVGRSDRQAYAYITYKRDKMLSEEADKRLKAIKEFTEFGSGFKIAMRDLEIRGAGSLLGEIQHGHMEQVGYETYCKLLDEVVKEMQGQVVEEEKEITIDLNVSSYIPEEYIESGRQKIEIYQEIALCKNEQDIENVIDEMIDRFGDIPIEAQNLMEIARIKNMCRDLSIIKLQQKGNNILVYINENKFKIEIIQDLLKQYKNKLKIANAKDTYISYSLDKLTDKSVLNEIKELLGTMLRLCKE